MNYPDVFAAEQNSLGISKQCKRGAPNLRVVQILPIRASLALIALLRLPLGAFADEFHVQAHGHFTCMNNGAPMPLAFARVELMDSDSDTDTLSDDLLGVTYTNANGDFSVDGVGGDGGNYSWSRPDVYARVILSDDAGPQGVRLTDELNDARSYATPQHDHDNSEGDVDIGSWWWGTQAGGIDNASACGIWLLSRQAFTEYAGLTHDLPPAGHYDIEYWSGIWAGEGGGPTPWTNVDTTHWPRHYHTGSVNVHEFAHTVRHTFDGDGNHFNWDVTRFIYAQHHDPCQPINYPSQGFAFNEGWAEFWAYQVTAPCGSVPNFADEGDVAARLYAIIDPKGVGLTKLDPAKVAADRLAMLSVLRANPAGIHSYAEFCDAMERQVPGSCVGVTAGPLTVSPTVARPTAPSREAQRQWLHAELKAQRQAASALADALSRARRRAATTRPVCGGFDCQAVFSALTEPAFIAGALRIRQLAVRRLALLIDESRIERDPGQRSRAEAQYEKEKRRYLEQIRAAGLASMSQALQDATRLARSNPTAAGLRERLARKVTTLKATATGPGSLPASWQPTFASDEQAGQLRPTQ